MSPLKSSVGVSVYPQWIVFASFSSYGYVMLGYVALVIVRKFKSRSTRIINPRSVACMSVASVKWNAPNIGTFK